MTANQNIIEMLGGSRKVAEILGILGEPGAVQRVSNWRTRGIPPKVLLDHPQLLRKAKQAERESGLRAPDPQEVNHA